MTRSFDRACHCCGAAFVAYNPAARWCSSRCSMRAYQRRRRGAPEADAGITLALQPTVLQPEVIRVNPDPFSDYWPNPTPPLAVREWNGTPIQRRADGYVNATAMCVANGKRWHDFRSTAQCEAYIHALATETGISGFDLIASQRGGTEAGGRTWVHPDLATELARWISPAFSVFVNRWFRAEVEGAATPQLPTTPPASLPTGIHIVAPSARAAAQLWFDAVRLEVNSKLSRGLNPANRHDDAIRPSPYYSWQQSA